MFKKQMKHLLTVLAITTAMVSVPTVSNAAGKNASDIEQGKELAFSRSKGNCLACHAIPGGNLPGNIGPALIAMKLRFPEKSDLFDKIWGKPDKSMPYSMMPQFGHNGVLTDAEINKIVDFLYQL